MPLILFCGYPCSGKSIVAEKLTDRIRHLRPDNCNVEIVSEEAIARGTSASAPTSNIPDPRCTIYASPTHEKQLRSQIKSETERILASSNKTKGPGAVAVVIVDANNYIKGYRYEMHCVAKSMRHRHAVIHCTTSEEACRQTNKQISRYPDELFDNLVSRFEKPNPNSRWDSPLYQISLSHQPEEEGAQDLDQLIDNLAGRVITELLESGIQVKPNQSTVPAKSAANNYLQVIDKATNEVIRLIVAAQSRGDEVLRLPNQEDVILNLSNEEAWTPTTLAKAKRSFLSFVRSGLGSGATTRLSKRTTDEEASALFIRFLDNEAQRSVFLN